MNSLDTIQYTQLNMVILVPSNTPSGSTDLELRLQSVRKRSHCILISRQTDSAGLHFRDTHIAVLCVVFYPVVSPSVDQEGLKKNTQKATFHFHLGSFHWNVCSESV